MLHPSPPWEIRARESRKATSYRTIVSAKSRVWLHFARLTVQQRDHLDTHQAVYVTGKTLSRTIPRRKAKKKRSTTGMSVYPSLSDIHGPTRPKPSQEIVFPPTASHHFRVGVLRQRTRRLRLSSLKIPTGYMTNFVMRTLAYFTTEDLLTLWTFSLHQGQWLNELHVGIEYILTITTLITAP